MGLSEKVATHAIPWFIIIISIRHGTPQADVCWFLGPHLNVIIDNILWLYYISLIANYVML